MTPKIGRPGVRSHFHAGQEPDVTRVAVDVADQGGHLVDLGGGGGDVGQVHSDQDSGRGADPQDVFADEQGGDSEASRLVFPDDFVTTCKESSQGQAFWLTLILSRLTWVEKKGQIERVALRAKALFFSFLPFCIHCCTHTRTYVPVSTLLTTPAIRTSTSASRCI